LWNTKEKWQRGRQKGVWLSRVVGPTKITRGSSTRKQNGDWNKKKKKKKGDGLGGTLKKTVHILLRGGSGRKSRAKKGKFSREGQGKNVTKAKKIRRGKRRRDLRGRKGVGTCDFERKEGEKGTKKVCSCPNRPSLGNEG